MDSQYGPGNEVWSSPSAAPGVYRIYANLYNTHGVNDTPTVTESVIHRGGSTALPSTRLTAIRQEALMATVSVVRKKIGIDPVVGWLVCIEGAEKGRDCRIRSERNFVGRDPKMDICIGGDDSISRDNHAVISFNPKKNTYRLTPGESRGIINLNEEEVATPTVLNAYDKIELGQTKLLFVPFCGKDFTWA